MLLGSNGISVLEKDAYTVNIFLEFCVLQACAQLLKMLQPQQICWLYSSRIWSKCQRCLSWRHLTGGFVRWQEPLSERLVSDGSWASKEKEKLRTLQHYRAKAEWDSAFFATVNLKVSSICQRALSALEKNEITVVQASMSTGAFIVVCVCLRSGLSHVHRWHEAAKRDMKDYALNRFHNFCTWYEDTGEITSVFCRINK